MSAIGGHAELAPHMSAFGVKQTLPFSRYDPVHVGQTAANDNYQMTPTSELIDDLLKRKEKAERKENTGDKFSG